MDWHPQDHISFVENVHMRPLDPSSAVSFDISNTCQYQNKGPFLILKILKLQITDPNRAKLGDTVCFTGPPKTDQKLWPAHCVQESWGSEFHKDLIVSNIFHEFSFVDS